MVYTFELFVTPCGLPCLKEKTCSSDTEQEKVIVRGPSLHPHDFNTLYKLPELEVCFYLCVLLQNAYPKVLFRPHWSKILSNQALELFTISIGILCLSLPKVVPLFHIRFCLNIILTAIFLKLYSSLKFP